MEVQPKQPSAKGPAERFTGDVWYDVIASGEAPSRVRVTSSASPPEPATPGTPARSGRPCTSPRASG
jgi:hypothetical protein